MFELILFILFIFLIYNSCYNLTFPCAGLMTVSSSVPFQCQSGESALHKKRAKQEKAKSGICASSSVTHGLVACTYHR